jgi:hypothetical protein
MPKCPVATRGILNVRVPLPMEYSLVKVVLVGLTVWPNARKTIDLEAIKYVPKIRIMANRRGRLPEREAIAICYRYESGTNG